MKRKNKVAKPRSNPIIIGFINMFFDLIKHFIKDFENLHKVKKIDKFDKQFSTLEHLVLKLEEKMNENRRQLEDLKSRLMWGNLTIIILVIINIFLIIK
ncbi:MAG: hypothetical protein K8S23_02770 [Candidatus Cloacimonetes bacterium]|nr:hypothetical protein [Candidatus Cloacimonadota bacterium]